MDADKVAQAVAESGVKESYIASRNALDKVWLQNRKVLTSMVLDDNAPEGIDAAEDLPVLIDEAIAALLALRDKTIALTWDVQG